MVLGPTARSLSTLGLLLSALQASPALASDPTSLTLDQTPLAFPLVVEREGRTVWYRVTLASAVETVVLEPGRKLKVLENADVLAVIEGGSERLAGRLVLAEASTSVDTRGKATLSRTATLRSSGGDELGRLTIEMELDLMGLGEERPQIEVSRAEVVELRGAAGPLAGAALKSKPLIAHPALPLVWRSTGTEVLMHLDGRTIRGSLDLARGLHPEAFKSAGGSAATIALGSPGSDAARVPLSIEWTRNEGAWHGTFHADLGSIAVGAGQRVSVRLGDHDSPLSIQAIAKLEPRAQHAMLVR